MSNWHDRHRTAYDREHERELQKHEPRPSDPLPHRLSPPIAGALEVAIMVKGLANITDAADLIEQYARTAAAEARLQAVIDTSDRIIDQLNGTVAR